MSCLRSRLVWSLRRSGRTRALELDAAVRALDGALMSELGRGLAEGKAAPADANPLLFDLSSFRAALGHSCPNAQIYIKAKQEDEEIVQFLQELQRQSAGKATEDVHLGQSVRATKEGWDPEMIAEGLRLTLRQIHFT